MRAESDDYYYANYVRWYNTEPFRAANGRIPQVNHSPRLERTIHTNTIVVDLVTAANHNVEWLLAMHAESDDYYYANYVRWYNTEPFRAANGRIPQVNIWDIEVMVSSFVWVRNHSPRLERTIHTNTIVVDLVTAANVPLVQWLFRRHGHGCLGGAEPVE
jgi:hypothetical protein